MALPSDLLLPGCSPVGQKAFGREVPVLTGLP